MAALLVSTSALAAPVPRDGAISGRIVARKQGETAVLVPTPQQRPAEVRQDLKAGDVLRTNAAGTLAIVFADRTQIRLGRNSTLVVKTVRAGTPSSVQLQRGSVWARSPRGAANLSVETPSATAAIRGTEYSIVATDEQTTLTVVEGVVDFFNPQGQLEITAGQSAAARLGSAPTRIVTVNPDSREQMLYYLSLDGALNSLQPSPLPQVGAGQAVARVKAIAPASRSAEDWLTLAENGVGVETRATIEEALTRARGASLSPQQDARAKLVEANIASKARDFRRALQLQEEAYPLLTGRQRETTRYGIFIARTLVDPDAAEGDLPPLDPEQPVSYAGQAFLTAYLGDFDKARAIAEEGLQRFPEESLLYTVLAGIGVLTGNPAAMDDASQRALRIDPQDAFANRVRTELELSYRGNPEGAIANARRGTLYAPGDDEMWNVLSQALGDWDKGREAERAIRRGLDEAPNSFVLRGNYALTLMQQQRVAEARRELALARALDPDNAVSHLAEGFLDLTEGRLDEALPHALDASAANPAYGEALLLLAEIYYNQGEYELAAQQIDAADRADPNNPFVALYRAAFAIDTYRADEAILAAREALRRYRARGGVYASLSESRGTGSYIAGAFRFLGLDEWARYYGDRTYDPFVSATVFDRALSGAPDPFLFRYGFSPFDAETAGDGAAVSDVFQGIRLDPLSIAGNDKGLQLTRQKFVELEVSPALVAHGDTVSLSQSASLNGVLLAPVPFAYSVTATNDRLALPTGSNNRRRGESLLGFVGAKLSPYDNLVINAGYNRQRNGLPGTDADPRDNGLLRDRSTSVYALYSHQFDRENIVTLGGGYTDTRRRLRRDDSLIIPDPFDPENVAAAILTDYSETTNSTGWFGFGNYSVGLGPVELQVGGEYFSTRANREFSLDLTTVIVDPPSIDTDTLPDSERIRLGQYRAYGDLRFKPSDRFVVQGQIALTGRELNGAGDDSDVDLSIGAGFAPVEGQWLRAAYVRASNIALPFSMAPTAVAGLRQGDAPVPTGTRSEAIIARWEAEWSAHLFTAIEWQHQTFAALSFDKANFVEPFAIAFDTLDFGLAAYDAGRAKLDRISGSASVWLTGNVGLRGTYAFTDSQVKEGQGAGEPIPFAAKHSARGQITWTQPGGVKINAGVSYLGPRRIDLFGARDKSAWLGDVQLTLESRDQSVQFNAGLFNLFDEAVQLMPGVTNFGRTFAASLDFRF